MTRFAFVIHPLTAKDAAKKYPIARFLPDRIIESALSKKAPFMVSDITGIESLTGAKTEGVFIGLPLTPHMMIHGVPLQAVYDRLEQCARIAEEEGAEIIGLGAFTSVVGDGGVTLSQRTKIAVTTGNSYTVATAIEGTLKACRELEIEPKESVLAVVGATGSIGRTCARALTPEFRSAFLVGRDRAKTEALAKEVPGACATTDLDVLREADAIVTVTSAETAIIEPDLLKPGAVVCDVARPRDVSVRVARERPDVLVIEGGVVKVPGNVDFHFDFGFPPKTAYACMSETMMLALEGTPKSLTLGKDVSLEQVEETQRLAARHGFELAGFRSFEKAVDRATIDRVKAARRRPATV